jgi:hypothetical protein
MGLTSCRWITIAATLAGRRRGAQPASCRDELRHPEADLVQALLDQVHPGVIEA